MALGEMAHDFCAWYPVARHTKKHAKMQVLIFFFFHFKCVVKWREERHTLSHFIISLIMVLKTLYYTVLITEINLSEQSLIFTMSDFLTVLIDLSQIWHSFEFIISINRQAS